jgi:hypothetical protein
MRTHVDFLGQATCEQPAPPLTAPSHPLLCVFIRLTGCVHHHAAFAFFMFTIYAIFCGFLVLFRDKIGAGAGAAGEGQAAGGDLEARAEDEETF